MGAEAEVMVPTQQTISVLDVPCYSDVLSKHWVKATGLATVPPDSLIPLPELCNLKWYDIVCFGIVGISTFGALYLLCCKKHNQTLDHEKHNIIGTSTPAMLCESLLPLHFTTTSSLSITPNLNHHICIWMSTQTLL